MNHDVLKLNPRNLPVYTYRLEAKVALVKDRIAYKISRYTFSKISVAVNQPLRVNDVLMPQCCYFGNENTEIIAHLQKKHYLGGAEQELNYYYGCRIDRLAISYVDENDCYGYASSGDGSCTVFIELSAGKLGNEYRRLFDMDEDKISSHEAAQIDLVEKEYQESWGIEYWKKRIPKWDEQLECIGEIPHNLIY
ncbi:hypothetical protein NIES4071_109600 (plasmid) [Calothrix sp. NIES-4071]|nr:hypothetical protein NIES4071_109600 [Calothrix sp. NIES-4071]BAZ65232.1 hypothetical protein NIES4105_109650 [Calothrix sp. NIES-4105]